MYKLVFYNFYLAVKYLKNTPFSKPFSNIKLGSVLSLSFFEVVNAITFTNYFNPHENIMWGKQDFEFIFFLSLFGGLNFLYFTKGDRFNIIIKEISQKPKKELLVGKVVTITYCFLSIFFLWLVIHPH